MTWSAQLIETVVGRDNHFESVVSLSNGTDTFLERFIYSGQTSDLRQRVIAWTQSFDQRQAYLSALTPGAPIDTTATVVSDPVVQSQLTYLTRWNLYQASMRAFNAGLPVSSSSISQLQTWLINSYTTAYLPYL